MKALFVIAMVLLALALGVILIVSSDSDAKSTIVVTTRTDSCVISIEATSKKTSYTDPLYGCANKSDCVMISVMRYGGLKKRACRW